MDDNRFLRHDGANLAAFLYFLSHKHRDSYDLIRRTVRLVAPFFDDFQLQPQALNQDKIRLEWRHRGSDAYFDASSLSDGTLRFIVLATLLLQPVSLRPSVILLDEPELGLHPYAVTILASLVRQASVETQVLFATQSTLLLDQFQPEDVLVVDRVDGGTKLTRLDAANLQEWLQDYSLGQLWERTTSAAGPSVAAPSGSRTDVPAAGSRRGPDRGDLRQRAALPAPHAVRVVDGQRAPAGKRAPPGPAGRNQVVGVRPDRNRKAPPRRRPPGSVDQRTRILRQLLRETGRPKQNMHVEEELHLPP